MQGANSDTASRRRTVRSLRRLRRPRFPPLRGEQALIAEAERRARKRLLFLQKLPLRLFILIPLAMLLSFENKAVLMITILVLGTVYLPIGLFIACKVADILEPLDVHVRREIGRLRQEPRFTDRI